VKEAPHPAVDPMLVPTPAVIMTIMMMMVVVVLLRLDRLGVRHLHLRLLVLAPLRSPSQRRRTSPFYLVDAPAVVVSWTLPVTVMPKTVFSVIRRQLLGAPRVVAVLTVVLRPRILILDPMLPIPTPALLFSPLRPRLLFRHLTPNKK